MNSFHKILLLSSCIAITTDASAQEAKTYGDPYSAPVFERVDQNGVDLVTGSYRITSPTLVYGQEYNQDILGLEWTGKGWAHLDMPTIWRKDSTYTVNYMGTSQEFKGRTDNYAEKKPITGAKLSCRLFLPSGITSECIYTHRNGDVLHFKGMYSDITPYVAAYGNAVSAWGNLGMSSVTVYSVDSRTRTWGQASPGLIPSIVGQHSAKDYTLTNLRSSGYRSGPSINTPNNGTNSSTQHYLRPKNTIQTFTDSAGSVWKYTVNDSRLMTKVDSPGNAADVNIQYQNGRVWKVTNPNGTWIYTYSSTNNNIRTTTVTNPLNEVTKVKYNTDKGYVLEHLDPLSRLTRFEYDTGDRLRLVVYPEFNSVEFLYDVRGNIIRKTENPKPGSNLTPITETAEYPTTCSSPVICNRPISVTDSLSRTTNYEYETPSQAQAPYYYPSPPTFTYEIGTGKPKTVTSPAPSPGAARPQMRYQYGFAGVPIRTAYCRTLASCAGTADEVVTTTVFNGLGLIAGTSTTSEGVTLTTCYDYDGNGRIVSETPPRAEILSCPTPNSNQMAPTAAAHAPAIAEPASAPVFPTP